MQDAAQEKLRQAIFYFTRETRIMDGMAVAFGYGDWSCRAWDGREIGEETLFDLASVTKIFTGLCLMRLWEEKKLDPYRRVTWYCPEFSSLDTVTVEQLMGFQVRIETPERIDRQGSRAEALACLLNAKNAGAPGKRAYSDIPAMILKYVLEAAWGGSMWSCVQKLILEPAGMTQTFSRVPEDKKKNCLLYDPEYRIEGENWICRRNPERGVPHDPKAAVLQGRSEDLCGHAGLFATLEDMEKLARAILRGNILSKQGLERMTVNRTGRMLPDGSFTQYLGYCCYLKHPDQYFSEIPETMSPAAFGIGGFTGNHFSVDPGTGRYTVFLGNRVRERLTMLIPPAGKSMEDYGLQPEGLGEIRWQDGSLHPSSANYVHQKDAHLHAVIDTILADRKASGQEGQG